MSFWLPIAFICFSNGNCGFATGALTATASECEEINYVIRHKLVTDLTVGAFELTCAPLPKKDFI